jgi:hypothetical protein
MKNYILLSILFFSTSLIAQNTQSVQSFNIWGQGGYSKLIIKNSEVVSNIGGFGGILGLGYGIKYKHFILEVGLEFDYKSSSLKYNDFKMQVGKFIDENTGEEIPLGTTITSEMRPIVEGGFVHTDYNSGNRFVMQYHFTDLQDRYKIGYLNIPLRLGGTFNGFYFLVGPKFGFNVLSYAETGGKHTSTGYFPQDMGYLEDMPHHSFVRDKADNDKTHFNGKLSLNLAASAEMGVNFLFSNTQLQELRFAVFADYGLLNINTSNNNTNRDIVYIPATDKIGLDPNIVKYNSFVTSNVKPSVIPFITGLKITMLFISRSNCDTCYGQSSSRQTKWWVVGSKKRY